MYLAGVSSNLLGELRKDLRLDPGLRQLGVQDKGKDESRVQIPRMEKHS